MKTSDPLATPAAAAPDTQDYQTIVGLLAAYSAVAIRLVDFQQGADLALLEFASKHRLEIGELQERQNSLAEQMEIIVRRHPEWFTDKKSLVTPCGAIKLTSTTSLKVANEELSIALIEQVYPISPELYVRTEKSLNLEALEALNDVELARLKITRVKGESFSVVPAKAKLGNAVSKAADAAAREGGKP